MFAEVVQAGGDSTLYGLLLLLHILCAIVGFGGVLLNGLYAQQAQQRKGREGVAIGQANWAVSKVAEIFIYLVFVFGVLLMLVADEPVEWSDAWVGLAILLYLIALGLSHGVLQPSVRKANALAEELATTEGPPPGAGGPPPQVAQLEALGKKIGMTAMVNDVLLLAILYLMIWKPGLY